MDKLSASSLLGEYNAIRERCLTSLSTVTPREFAETVMRMPDEHGATRPFTFRFAPYQLEPYLEIFNSRNEEVDMMMFSRGGKSRIFLTALGFIIVHRPRRIGVMWPTEGDGRLWVKDDFMGELVEPTPEVAALIENSLGRRTSANTILHKRFTGGSMTVIGSNAMGRARRMKAEFLGADEIDAIQSSATDEGDQRFSCTRRSHKTKRLNPCRHAFAGMIHRVYLIIMEFNHGRSA